MNTKYIALWAIVMLLLASCAPKEELTNSQINTATEVATTEEIPVASSTESLIAYSDYNGEDLSNVWKQTVLFFHQASCGTCVKTDKDIMSQSELPDNLNIIKIDFDTETELNAKYWVTTKHTFVLIDEDGKMLAKEIGLATTGDIAAFANAWSNSEVNIAEEAIAEEVQETVPELEVVPEAEVSSVEADTSANIATEVTVPTPVIAASSKWEYKEYTGTIDTQSVLFFSAAWCPSCVAADKGFSAENELAIDADILKVDYDNSADLKKMYGVTSQHTFVLVDAEGNMIKKMAWGTKSSDLLALFN